jgi:guanine deaminase
LPLAERLATGISVGLGSDVSGGAEVSLFGVMRTGAYAQQARRALVEDAAGEAVLGPLDWLRLGTIAGAQALGLDDRIGSLEAGKDGDLIAVDPARTAPLGSPDEVDLGDPELLMSRLIFRATDSMVRAAWVRGRRLEGPS